MPEPRVEKTATGTRITTDRILPLLDDVYDQHGLVARIKEILKEQDTLGRRET
jgi:hypothetical protein